MTDTSEVEKFYYVDQGFYSSLFINTAYANGYKDEDLTEISTEDYETWFSPPEGKYGAWIEGKPVILDFPPINYIEIAEQLRQDKLNEVTTATSIMQSKLSMGRKLTTAETAKMNAWLDYSDLLNALEFTEENAQSVEWPAKPKL